MPPVYIPRPDPPKFSKSEGATQFKSRRRQAAEFLPPPPPLRHRSPSLFCLRTRPWAHQICSALSSHPLAAVNLSRHQLRRAVPPQAEASAIEAFPGRALGLGVFASIPAFFPCDQLRKPWPLAPDSRAPATFTPSGMAAPPLKKVLTCGAHTSVTQMNFSFAGNWLIFGKS